MRDFDAETVIYLLDPDTFRFVMTKSSLWVKDLAHEPSRLTGAWESRARRRSAMRSARSTPWR